MEHKHDTFTLPAMKHCWQCPHSLTGQSTLAKHVPFRLYLNLIEGVRPVDQLSEETVASALDSAASFKRSALQMYLVLLFGANLALAFLAWAFNSCCIFLRRFIFFHSICKRRNHISFRIEPVPCGAHYVHRLFLACPHGQFIAIRINKVETASTWKRKGLAADNGTQRLKAQLGGIEIIRIQND